MSLRRTPDNFPRMKHRARKRRGPRITLWDAAWMPVASTHTRFRPDMPSLRGMRIESATVTADDPELRWSGRAIRADRPIEVVAEVREVAQ